MEQDRDIPKDVLELLEQYLERFGDTAPIALMPFPWIRAKVKEALATGQPILEPELPEAAVA